MNVLIGSFSDQVINQHLHLHPAVVDSLMPNRIRHDQPHCQNQKTDNLKQSALRCISDPRKATTRTSTRTTAEVNIFKTIRTSKAHTSQTPCGSSSDRHHRYLTQAELSTPDVVVRSAFCHDHFPQGYGHPHEQLLWHQTWGLHEDTHQTY